MHEAGGCEYRLPTASRRMRVRIEIGRKREQRKEGKKRGTGIEGNREVVGNGDPEIHGRAVWSAPRRSVGISVTGNSRILPSEQVCDRVIKF